MGIVIYRDSAQGKRLLGRIDHVVGDSAVFQYDEDYLAQALAAGELGVSELLPLRSNSYDPSEFGSFFRGLLPEGDTLEDLAHLYQIPRNDYLSLLEQLGCESIGALTFVSEKVDPDEYLPKYDHLAQDRIESLKTSPVRGVVQETSETRLSLSGAQSKIAWFLPEEKDAKTATLDDWLIPKGTAPSTHIIKIARKGEEDIAFNELACSKLSEACGFPTAKVTSVPEIDGAIAIERYDRIWVENDGEKRLLRLHQEDFCQALGLAPYQKYQPDGTEGDYLCKVARLLESTSSNPIIDKQEFAKRTLFNYVIGNSDAHLKNSSLIYNARWTSRALAPMYDLTCIPLTGYSTKMPFDIGKRRLLSEIDDKDLMSIPLDLDIPLDAFDELAIEVLTALEYYDIRSEEEEVAKMMQRILMDARSRIETVKRYLDSGKG